jgi:hypothetical protein
MPKTFLARMENVSDMKVKDCPSVKFPESLSGEWVHCPACQGYGGWNLELNAYGPGKHFQAGCFQCVGWGWVRPNSPDSQCVHDYKKIANPRMFEHVTQCQKCKHTVSYDSSG